jgi:hypothetical protein
MRNEAIEKLTLNIGKHPGNPRPDPDRLSIVIQKIRQLRMQKTEIRFTSRSAVRSLDSSALQTDLRILWKVSIFHATRANSYANNYVNSFAIIRSLCNLWKGALIDEGENKLL